jgi:hypothetical protein
LVSNSSGATAPSTTFANQFWVDTAADPSVLKIRNADNDAWITIGEIDQTGDKFNLTCANATISENLTLNAQGDLRFADSDSSNWVAFQAPATVASNVTWTLPATDGTSGQALTTDGSGTLSWAAGSPENGYNFRNRIINGDMRIDQRNAGAAVTAPSSFPVDRFLVALTSGVGAFSAQQDSSVPAGFTTSTKITVTTADGTIDATDNFAYQTWIEGNNIADLGFGTASAKTVTISFWVRGSVTGTYAMVIGNSNAGTGAANRSYVSTYTINSADTWEYKTVTVPGDTSGTWQTGNLRGMLVRFGLTAGTDFQQAAGSWGTGNAIGTSSTVQLLSTLNATWYVTGVQLEVGSSATSFDYRPYGTELSLCQRYYYKVQAAGASSFFGVGYNSSTTVANALTSFPVQMRVAPSALEQSGTASDYRIQQASAVTCSSVPIINASDIWAVTTVFTVASGLTAGNAIMFRSANSNAFLAWSAEL